MNLKTLKEIFRYPSVIAGVVIILALAAVAVYAVVSIPYGRAVELWRGNEADWYQNPKNAAPVWYNWFRSEKLPETLDLKTDTDTAITKTVKDAGDGNAITYEIPFNYDFDGFPDDMSLYFTSNFDSKAPFVGLTWISPDGTETRLGNFSIDRKYTYRMDQDQKVTRKLGGVVASKALFTNLKKKARPPWSKARTR